MMDALIFDGSWRNDRALAIAREVFETRLKKNGWHVRSFTLRDIKIAPCMGCFRCWIMTPGICAIRDAGQDIAKVAAQSDLWIFLTNVTFGGYSSELKKAIDRIICLCLPFFKKVDNEIHHPLRYGRRWAFISVGSITAHNAAVEDTFKRLVQRNANNFQSSSCASDILLCAEDESEILKKINNLISTVSLKYD